MNKIQTSNLWYTMTMQLSKEVSGSFFYVAGTMHSVRDLISGTSF